LSNELSAKTRIDAIGVAVKQATAATAAKRM
jgi:hypothetical protein